MKNYWAFAWDNPTKVTANHAGLLFFIINKNNSLGWKEVFGLPTEDTMQYLGIRKVQTYMKYLNDLIDFGFVKMVKKSRNQHHANQISLYVAMSINGKADGKATEKQLKSKDTIDRLLKTTQTNKDGEDTPPPPFLALFENANTEFVSEILPEYQKSQKILILKKYLLRPKCYGVLFKNSDSFFENCAENFGMQSTKQVSDSLLRFFKYVKLHKSTKQYWNNSQDMVSHYFYWMETQLKAAI